jgi:hypothetical protein
MRRLLRLLAPIVALLSPATVVAQGQGNFDLTGPSLTLTVERGGVSLPVGQVPSLAEGDEIHVAADLPQDQAARYLLVVGFLRGATNPPPKSWFSVAETWEKKKSALTVTVPKGATQAIAFLAPETGGGRGAVIDAVRGRPGAFVRAANDLFQASLDRARLETFVAGVAKVEQGDPERLAQVSPKLAGALAIRLNADCLQRPRAAQAACLTQNRDGMVLQTGRTTTLAEQLTGTPTELAYSIAATREGGAGFYSPYIALARDVARLFGAFRTANYQYIPALAVSSGDRAKLMLNSAPSFQNPKSVLVVPLPPITSDGAPVMRPGAKDVACLTRPDLVLTLEDAPLLFATGFARDLALRVTIAGGKTIDLPVAADAERGGLIATQSALAAVGTIPITDAVLIGRWGFDRFTGPHFALQNGAADAWKPQPDNQVVVGRDHPLSLLGGAASCVDQVGLRDAAGAVKPVAFKSSAPDAITATLPLGKVRPGELTLVVTQFGGAPATIPLVAQREASRLDAFVLHPDEATGELIGARLDQVAELTVTGVKFFPGELMRRGDGDSLLLAPSDAGGTALSAVEGGGDLTARVRLRDGRGFGVPVTVAPPRPKVELVSRNVEVPPVPGKLALKLPEGVIPPAAKLVFSLRLTNGRFDPTDKVEVGTDDGAKTAMLTPANGTLSLVGDDIAVGSVVPRALLGAAAAGPLRARLVRGDVQGAWLPLARVVRLPELDRLACPRKTEACALSGDELFLVAAVAPAADFSGAAAVPAGFVGTKLEVPRPKGDALFLKLHDAPDAVIRVSVAE